MGNNESKVFICASKPEPRYRQSNKNMTTIINEFKYENIDQMLNLQSKNNSKAYIQDWIMTF